MKPCSSESAFFIPSSVCSTARLAELLHLAPELLGINTVTKGLDRLPTTACDIYSFPFHLSHALLGNP